MNEPLVDIVAVPDHPGVARWRAVAAHGTVAGVAGLRPLTPLGQDFLLPAAPVQPAGELTLYVEPQWRRRGIGSRLLAAVRAHTAESRLVTDVAPGSPGEAFCTRHGFRRTRSMRHHLLTYGDVHRAWLDELVDAEHPGYRLLHWTGDLPAAPRFEELIRSPSGPGNTVLTVADTDGHLAAYALGVVSRAYLLHARQYGPVVRPGHRGRRLGRWVNAALIRRLREVHPRLDEVEAVTAADDAHLIAVREHLGFHPLRRTRRYELAQP